MRHHRILTALASLGLATAGLALVGQPAEAADSRCNRTNDSLRKLLECVTLDGVMDHQRAFQRDRRRQRRHPRVRHPWVRRLGRLRRGAPGTRRLRRDPTGVRVPRLRCRRALDPEPDRTDPDHVRRGHRLRPDAAVRAGRGHRRCRPGRHQPDAPARQHERLRDRRLRHLPGRQHRSPPARHLHVRAEGQQRGRRRRSGHHLLQPGQRPQRPRPDGHPRCHPGRRLHRRDPRGEHDLRAGCAVGADTRSDDAHERQRQPGARPRPRT